MNEKLKLEVRIRLVMELLKQEDITLEDMRFVINQIIAWLDAQHTSR